jgi:hypothetical protein
MRALVGVSWMWCGAGSGRRVLTGVVGVWDRVWVIQIPEFAVVWWLVACGAVG